MARKAAAFGGGGAEPSKNLSGSQSELCSERLRSGMLSQMAAIHFVLNITGWGCVTPPPLVSLLAVV